MTQSKYDRGAESVPCVAGNGLLDRRALLGRGFLLACAVGAGTAGAARPH